MRHALISILMMLGAICGSGSAQSSAEDKQPGFERPWTMSPQICRGKPWSSTAKAAGWSFDAERSVCRATANNDSMIASVIPMKQGRFIVRVGLQMQKGATVRLFMDEIAFDLSDDGQRICVTGGPEFLKFHVERPEGQLWSVLRIERKQATLIVTLNGKEVIRFDDKGRPYARVGLKPVSGTIEVNGFTLTGNVIKGAQEQPLPKK